MTWTEAAVRLREVRLLIRLCWSTESTHFRFAMIFQRIRGTRMSRNYYRVVLLLLLLVAALTPLMQLDSWDRFPVSSDDIEYQVTFCLCSVGMVLVLTQILQFVAIFLRLTRPFVAVVSAEALSIAKDSWFPPGLLRLSTPLRI